MSNYNPSPWEVVVTEEGTSLGGTLCAVVDANGRVICNNEPYYPTMLDPDNAYLISVAPEMYEILPEILDFLTPIKEDYEKFYNKPPSRLKNLIDTIENIIERVK